MAGALCPAGIVGRVGHICDCAVRESDLVELGWCVLPPPLRSSSRIKKRVIVTTTGFCRVGNREDGPHVQEYEIPHAACGHHSLLPPLAILALSNNFYANSVYCALF